MSKNFQLVNIQQSGPSKEALLKTDWNKCLLCQETTSESLQCPANSNRCDVGPGQGYSTLSCYIHRFSELDELPMPIDLSRLDEGNGIEATLLEHKAKWHKSCRTKFNLTKLQRAEKRKTSGEGCDLGSKKYIPAHKIAASLGPDKSLALPIFHAYTGCDTVSFFNTKGKKTAWETWRAYNEATTTFLALSNGPADITDFDVAVLERFMI